MSIFGHNPGIYWVHNLFREDVIEVCLIESRLVTPIGNGRTRMRFSSKTTMLPCSKSSVILGKLANKIAVYWSQIASQNYAL